MHAEGAVLLHAGRGIVFAANRVGAAIWQALSSQTNIDRVAEAISTQFEVGSETARRDTLAFIAQLEGAGLLVRCANT